MSTSLLRVCLILGLCGFSTVSHAFGAVTISDWLCAGPDKRFTMASTLSLMAGQGEEVLGVGFFTRCIDDVASDGRASDRRLGEVAAACTQEAYYALGEKQ